MDDRDLEELGLERPPTGPSATAWMVTFTDLVSLMLTFFVMLFAMSSVQVDKWEKMIDALSQSLNPETRKTISAPTAKYNISTTFRKRAINLDYLAAVLEEAVARDALLRGSRVLNLEDRMIVALPGDLLFGPGTALLTERAQRAIFELGSVLRNVENRLGVNGHSDATPPEGGRYASNWELSLARAIAVANALRRAGYPEDITAHGFSNTRFEELPNLPPEQRQALARRVDIVILPTVGGN